MNRAELRILLNKAFEAGRAYQNGEHSEFHGGNEHNHPDFEKWYDDNLFPERIQEALEYMRNCESDMGFMGSPEYYEKKKLVTDYFDTIKPK